MYVLNTSSSFNILPLCSATLTGSALLVRPKYLYSFVCLSSFLAAILWSAPCHDHHYLGFLCIYCKAILIEPALGYCDQLLQSCSMRCNQNYIVSV